VPTQDPFPAQVNPHELPEQIRFAAQAPSPEHKI
jgi:hypothetical protein